MSRDDAIKLSVKALLEVVQTGAKNIEIAVTTKGKKVEFLAIETVDGIVKTIADEKEAEAQRKKNRGQPTTQSTSGTTEQPNTQGTGSD